MNKVDEKDLRQLYEDKCLPMHEVAKELGVSVGTVFNYCKMYGIQSRKTGDVLRGRTHTAEARRKISKANKGKVVSEESRKKMSESAKKGGIGHKKRRCDGYIEIYFPDHPKSNKSGYVMEHDLVMECVIGRHLKDDEVVHHKNRKKDDNRVNNLAVMTKAEHMRLHTKERHMNGGINHHTVKVINITTGEEFDSIKEAAKKYGLAGSNITRVCKGHRKKAKGCVWKYAS